MKNILLLITTFQLTMCLGQKSEQQVENEMKLLNVSSTKTRDSLHVLIKVLNEQYKLEAEADLHKLIYLRTDSLWNLADQIDIQELTRNLDFARKHPYSKFAFESVLQHISTQAAKNLYNEYEDLYANAEKGIKESEIGKKMAERLKFFKQSKVGSLAPLFQGKDHFGTKFSLGDLQGHYILLDFWASWCAPCREEFPYLKNLYKEYEGDGFTIVSISIDENLDSWRNAIAKEEIDNWVHFSTIENESDSKQSYFVSGIPHKVLIDKNGIIIGKWKGAGERNKQELSEQLEKLMGI